MKSSIGVTFAIFGCFLFCSSTAFAQQVGTRLVPQIGSPAGRAIPPASQTVGAKVAGPIKDVTYQIIWLIESDDLNRAEYEGPASNGLRMAGYGRLVPAGFATAAVTIGQPSTVTGGSRYGQLTVLTSLLNTTEEDELQIKIQLRTKNQSPLSIDTTMRAPMNRWFLIGSADSRVGLPKHAADGKRGLAIMKITDGVMLLDIE